jgi:hypothetical protein
MGFILTNRISKSAFLGQCIQLLAEVVLFVCWSVFVSMWLPSLCLPQLDHNPIGSRGGELLADAVLRNASLHHLSVRKCGIGGPGAVRASPFPLQPVLISTPNGFEYISYICLLAANHISLPASL